LQFYKEAYQVTILLTTHQFLDILTLADRAIVIEKGVITYNGSVDQLFDYYLKKKIIKVHFADPFIIPIENQLPGVYILKQTEKYMEMEIEVEKCSVQKVLEHLIKVAEISDFEVHSIPMDKVVEALYKKDTLLPSTVYGRM
jgi:ABC-2 type transport system ATP-binding protein